ncbi:MAG: hypothetical protein ACKUBY_00270 [Candidatus Moraniibacteriota bacterium]|jgi:hypothetical protein
MKLLTPTDLFQKKQEEKMFTIVSGLSSSINTELEIAFDENSLKKIDMKEITAKVDINSPVNELQPLRESITLTIKAICEESEWVIIPYVEIFINPGPNGYKSSTITLRGNFRPKSTTLDK